MTTMKRFCVGYALEAKKEKGVIEPSLINFAKDKGIDIVRIDIEKPLIEQGPFDCIIHKLYDDDWKNQLSEFESTHPGVIIIDPLDAIAKLRNRITMLDVMSQIETETLRVPKQTLIYDSESLMEDPVNLKFPLIAKPLIVDGSLKAHELSLVFNGEGLKKLNPPLVLQEFVNHGGVMFKVYVAGNHSNCVERKSLPDVPETMLGPHSATSVDVLPFSQVSGSDVVEEVVFPPASLVSEVANGLGKGTGIRLFNFDMIRESKSGTDGVDKYHVVDINYFPGYAKMPNYETLLTDFFLDLKHQSEQIEA